MTGKADLCRQYCSLNKVFFYLANFKILCSTRKTFKLIVVMKICSKLHKLLNFRPIFNFV